MTALRTIAGAVLTAVLILLISRVMPLSPDLSDWGGRAFPRSYLTPLLILAVISYFSGWVGAKLSPETGRLVGMLGSLAVGVTTIAGKFHAPLLEPLFQHPAYPVFSDHALLALAVLLVCAHLGGLRVEKSQIAKSTSDAAKPVDKQQDSTPIVNEES